MAVFLQQQFRTENACVNRSSIVFQRYKNLFCKPLNCNNTLRLLRAILNNCRNKCFLNVKKQWKFNELDLCSIRKLLQGKIKF